MKLRPETNFPNNVFLPHYSPPEKMVLDLNSFSVDTNSNGVPSILSLGESYIPYIDFSKFDPEREDWMWEDDYGLFYKKIKRADLEFTGYSDYQFACSSLNLSFSFDALWVTGKIDRELKREIIKVGIRNFYKFKPINLIINGVPLKDVTSYSFRSSNILSDINIEQNKEFYYSPETNKIFTNQNLDSFRPEDVILQFFVVKSTVSLYCKMSTNYGYPSKITSYIDYFTLKLRGQDIK